MDGRESEHGNKSMYKPVSVYVWPLCSATRRGSTYIGVYIDPTSIRKLAGRIAVVSFL
ncbi:hypothetical protein DAI22_02g288666 [Oryza sativa Japonica Group]|nr:hypothetical protein DAI22_02g288666 [Oryza sativa Japonica Group]